MNAKRLLLGCVAVFVFVFCYDWVFHDVLLKESYVKTASLWRPEAEMKAHFGWLVAGELLISIMFCVIYSLRGGPRFGVAQGVGYGVFVSLLLAGLDFITYTVQPLPLSLAGAWVVGRVIQLIGAGAILGAIYRPMSQTPSTTQTAPA